MTVIIKPGALNLDVINVVYNSVFDNGSITQSSQAVGFNATNIKDDATWNAWKPTAVNAFVTVDCGAPVACDAFGISSHNMGSSGSSFAIWYSSDGVTFSSATGSVFAPDTNEDIIGFFPLITARYWRFQLQGAVAAIGVVKVGRKLAFPCAPLDGHKPLHHSRKYEMLSNETLGGQFKNNRVVRIGAETSVNVGQVDREWAETDLAAFETHFNTGRTFFYCSSPVDFPKDMGYCKRPGGSGEMSITWVEGDIMADVNFDVRSYVST